MNTHVLLAVFRRNFVSYFASPTGYVFICVFVLLSAFAAFWPNEFFNENLANLDQLNTWFPFIMLIFIPAITMSVWADERRQGTDELLLTIPAGDFDIVLGKYLAALAIFTVALLFSLACNYLVLNNLASKESLSLRPAIDFGLFAGTYVGYWLIGLAMLAIGMVASFLTANLTISFILGAVFSAPLVFAVYSDAIVGSYAALSVKQWSIAEQFRDFGRGVITLAGIAYFVLIVVVALYLCMVLIGRRHWLSGRHRGFMVGHYAVRALAMVAIAIGLEVLLQHYNLRADATSEHLSSLSPQTYKLLRDLKLERPVQIEAFISPTVPEAYVQTRLNLVAMLRELQALGGAMVKVQIHDTERFSEEAALAEKRYGITPKQVATTNRGAWAVDQLFMGVAINCGLQKVILPFIDRGIPVEYELVRSICTVAQQNRKKLGVLTTDAQLYGKFNMQSMSNGSNWPIIDELEKQYQVVQVDPTKPITDKYDVLLAVQPSSLGPEEMENFIAAVRAGQPTAIFEDPLPVFAMNVPGTSMPKQQPGGMNMMMMGRQEMPKGDIEKLWRLLGVDFAPDQIVWQDYNPIPKISVFSKEKELVFVDTVSGGKFDPDDEISAHLQHLLFPFPGSITKLNTSAMEFKPLVRTGDLKTGIVHLSEIMEMSPFGPHGLKEDRFRAVTNMPYVLAAHVRGKVKVDAAPAEGGDKSADAAKGDAAKSNAKGSSPTDEKKPQEAQVDVVLVADIDMLTQEFFRIREQGDNPEAGIHFDFDNVTFVLNVLDELAGDHRFIEIRSRRPQHRTLARIESRTEAAKDKATKARDEFQKEYDASEARERKAFEDKIQELQKRKDVDPQQLIIEVAMAQQDGQRRLEAKTEQFRQKKEREVNKIETDLAVEIGQVQHQYKMWAVLLPPIPPLMLAVGVFFYRRSREREGVARSRLRG